MISNPLFQKCANLTLFHVRRTKQVLAEGAGVRSGWALSPWLWDQQGPWAGRGLAGAELETNSAPASLRQWLRVQGWSEMQPLSPWVWVVVPGETGQGCPLHPGPWEDSPVQRAGLEWHCQGFSPVRHFPASRSTVEVTPSCAHPLHRLCCVRPCTESELEETHKIIQSSCVTLSQFDQNLTSAYQMEAYQVPFQANFLTIPSLRTFLRGMGQIWNTLSMPNSLPCAMQRLHWCSALRFWKLCNKLMFTDYHSLFLSLESGTA